MANKPSVGIIIPNDFIKRLPFGGGSGFIQNIINALNYQVVIFGSGANGTPLWQGHRLNRNTIFQAAYAIHHPPSWPLRISALIGYMVNRKRILNSGVDLLYIHSPECALPFIFGKNRKPVIFHQHGSGNPVSTATYPWARNLFFKWIFDTIHHIIYKRSDWIVVIDRLCMDQATKHGAGRKLSLLMNAVDCRQFYPDQKKRNQMRRQYNLSDQETAIFFVGRLEELKRVNRIIKSLPEMSPGIKVKLFIAGEGSQRGKLEHLAARTGVEQQVNFLGKIPHNQLPYYYNMADLLALPSKMEGVPMVILEALACGKPVLATRVGGIPDLVCTGINGILMDKGTPSEIINGVDAMTARRWDPETVRGTISAWDAAAVSDKLLGIFKHLGGKK